MQQVSAEHVSVNSGQQMQVLAPPYPRRKGTPLSWYHSSFAKNSVTSPRMRSERCCGHTHTHTPVFAAAKVIRVLTQPPPAAAAPTHLWQHN